MELAKQYNQIAKDFSATHNVGQNSNRDNRAVFYTHLGFISPGMKVLDLGCGDGLDLAYYQSLGAKVCGVDASEDLVEIAQNRLPNVDIQVGFFENLPFETGTFDVVLSKYALQTSSNLSSCLSEVTRVLKPGGTLVYLVTHPFRQFFEKKDCKANYFYQTIVDSRILNNSMVVREPSHTLNEYFEAKFLQDFDIQTYQECWDPAAEQIGERKYPGYFILKATKRQKAPPFRLAVFSSASEEVSPANAPLAEQIGRYLAHKGVTVVTGGSGGIPGLVVKAAVEAGGTAEVFSPDPDEHSHHARPDNLPLHYFANRTFIPGFSARSLAMVKAVDAALVLNGRIGTLSEFTIALEEGRDVAVITGTGGVADQLQEIVKIANKEFPNKVFFESDYKKAIDMLITQKDPI